MKKSIKYIVVNLIVLLLFALQFLQIFHHMPVRLEKESLYELLIPAGTALVVLGIKACRLYLEMYESELGIRNFLKVYCKVTPVSIILPYKVGELFRMYCFGREIGNNLKGIVVIILDRFMDTIALLTMILLIGLYTGGSVSSLVFVFLIFLGSVLLVYYLFPGIYIFWKKYFMQVRAEERTLSMLKLLQTLNRIYQEITRVNKGRGMLLYTLSLAAWSVEIGSVYLMKRLSGSVDMNDMVSAHLFSALTGESNLFMRRFIFSGVIMMIAASLLIRAVELIGKSSRRSKRS